MTDQKRSWKRVWSIAMLAAAALTSVWVWSTNDSLVHGAEIMSVGVEGGNITAANQSAVKIKGRLPTPVPSPGGWQQITYEVEMSLGPLEKISPLKQTAPINATTGEFEVVFNVSSLPDGALGLLTVATLTGVPPGMGTHEKQTIGSRIDLIAKEVLGPVVLPTFPPPTPQPVVEGFAPVEIVEQPSKECLASGRPYEFTIKMTHVDHLAVYLSPPYQGDPQFGRWLKHPVTAASYTFIPPTPKKGYRKSGTLYFEGHDKNHSPVGGAWASFREIRKEVCDTTPPRKPSGLRILKKTSRAVTLAWDGSDDRGGSGIDFYRVVRTTCVNGVYEKGGPSEDVAAKKTRVTMRRGLVLPMPHSRKHVLCRQETFAVVAFDKQENHSEEAFITVNFLK